MSHYLHHEPCPRCRSKDNLARYSDGHAWCFGCGYKEPPVVTIQSIRDRIYKEEVIHDDPDSVCLDYDIPTVPRRWLLKYGITEQESTDNGIGWKKDEQLLVLIQHNGFYQGRNFKDTGPKYLTRGKPILTFYGEGDILVVVEDVLSAIKVARVTASMPLLGSHMPTEWATIVCKRFREGRIWLDKDKAKESLKMARMLRERGLDCSSIITDLDPKEYSTREIGEYIYERSD